MEYRVLIQQINAEKFPPSKSEKVFDDMARSKILNKPNMFVSYWQVTLAESMQKKIEVCHKFKIF